MFDQLRAGDVVVVYRYDRLARSLAETVDTTTPTGQLVFHVFASIAEFERAHTRADTRGLEIGTCARKSENFGMTRAGQ